MLTANTPKERRLRGADVPWFPPIFLLSSPEFTISKRYKPVAVLVWPASYPRQRRKIKKQQLLANWLGRWPLPPCARVSCCFFQPYFPLRRAESSRRGRRRSQNRGLGGSEKPEDASDSGISARQPAPGGGKATSRAHRPAPSALLPATGTRHILPGSAWRGPNA